MGKEHALDFSGAMVRAILDGRKIQTRRILTRRNTDFDSHPWPKRAGDDAFDWEGAKAWDQSIWGKDHHLRLHWSAEGTFHRIRAKVEPGDRLWVREALETVPFALRYVADGDDDPTDYDVFEWQDHRTEFWEKHAYKSGDIKCEKISPIHMPRWASRITLEVVGVRVERVQEISEEDCEAEGVREWLRDRKDPDAEGRIEPIYAFRTLWDSIHGKKPENLWAANPWVVAITFKRVEQGKEARDE